MKECHVSRLWIVAALAAMGTGLGLSTGRAQSPPPRPDGEEGVQVLTRGPVHEAFAETVTFDPEPDIVVTKGPPESINEVPPDQRPEGVNVTWIPGYNAWDEERNDYLWVSGVWRSPPPGRQWVSGYWGRSGQGFQWTSGYWGDAQVGETEYLPEPPEYVELEPSGPAPSSDHSWIPGSWAWQHGRYVWRPGYWVTVQPDWIWVPSHYTWSPRGYVFVDGYWDYSVPRRGVIFAPVYFDAHVYSRRDYRYSPAVVIDLDVFSDHLFLRPRSRQYYFGDYYAANYRDAGFYPRFSLEYKRYGYDPIYAHQRWQHRQDHDWEGRIEGDFRRRRDNEDARPPRTYVQQLELRAKKASAIERSSEFATPLEQMAKRSDSPVRFRQVDNDEKQKLVQREQDVRKFREERRVLENQTEVRSKDEPNKISKTTKVRLPTSVIVAKPNEELSKDRVPPRRQEAPEPDLKVEPKPRKVRAKPDAAHTESKEQPKGKSKKSSNDD